MGKNAFEVGLSIHSQILVISIYVLPNPGKDQTFYFMLPIFARENIE
jgi:hypothetical protein